MVMASENQPSFALDDGTGLRVVHATFMKEQKFDWDLFRGYDQLRVLTYSASINAIVRMLDQHSFSHFECVFGCEHTLRDIKTILAFQQVVVGDTRAAIMGLDDRRHLRIWKRSTAVRRIFECFGSQSPMPSCTCCPARRSQPVVIGSANLSERAFSGKQSETLVVFDDDAAAWEHYNRMYDTIRDSASMRFLYRKIGLRRPR